MFNFPGSGFASSNLSLFAGHSMDTSAAKDTLDIYNGLRVEVKDQGTKEDNETIVKEILGGGADNFTIPGSQVTHVEVIAK